MVLSVLKKIVTFVPNKLLAINNKADKVINFTDTYVTKVTGATTGAAVATKGKHVRMASAHYRRSR